MPRIIGSNGKPLVAAKPETVVEEIAQIFVRENLTLDECMAVIQRLIFSCALNGASNLSDLQQFGQIFIDDLNKTMTGAANVIQQRGNLPPSQQND